MNEQPRRHGISRRDLIHGKIWRALGRQGESDDRGKPTRRPRKSLVMRYPQSLREVAANDAQQSSSAAASSAPERRRTIPLFRPPGAIDEESFLRTCTRCDDCTKACPHEAIQRAPERLREAAGTPIIEADHQPCLMCHDFPCVTACQVEALTDLAPKMMGDGKDHPAVVFAAPRYNVHGLQ